jgi:hypothetical protein
MIKIYVPNFWALDLVLLSYFEYGFIIGSKLIKTTFYIFQSPTTFLYLVYTHSRFLYLVSEKSEIEDDYI